MIDYRIEERVGEIIRTHFPNTSADVADPGPDGLEDVELGFLLKRDQKMFSQKHAHLLAAHRFAAVAVDHVGDDKQVIVVLFYLRALAGIEHIFEREGMKIEL